MNCNTHIFLKIKKMSFFKNIFILKSRLTFKMHRFWLLLLISKSLSFVTPFHLDNLIAVKLVKAVSFTGETQINRAFHTRRTNNALFAKSAFTFFIPKYWPMSRFVSS